MYFCAWNFAEARNFINVGARKYAPEIAMARFLCIFCAWNLAEALDFMHVSADVLKRDNAFTHAPRSLFSCNIRFSKGIFVRI